jgi:hypothetical protein
MGLDAFVFCDCFEKGKLREAPPAGFSPRVRDDGSLEPDRGNYSLDEILAWDEWLRARACEHSSGQLLHHRLGNVSLISSLRSELHREASRFPILLSKVVYSGSHGGDYLPVELIEKLGAELEALVHFKCSSSELEEFMTCFRKQMLELVAVSLSVKKPIVF